MLDFLHRKKAQDVESKKGWVAPSVGRGWWFTVREPFTGAWQKNQEKYFATIFNYPTLYACINRIVSDIGKLPFVVCRRGRGGVWERDDASSVHRILRSPNHYQTEAQFRELWILSKLLCGNAYILIGRDSSGAIESLHVLDWRHVYPMVTESGQVFYQLYTDKLNGVKLSDDYPYGNLVVPASEIVHDRMNCIFHPLIGVPPLAATYLPAMKNFKIIHSTDELFGAGQLGGILTAPAGISEDDADYITKYWQNTFGDERGKVAVLGADMKFTNFAQKASDYQMVEQLKYSDEQICQPFGVPLYKIGLGTMPSGSSLYESEQIYFGQALQAHVYAMEILLNLAFKMRDSERIHLDTQVMIRLDETKRAEVEAKLVGGMVKTPNESRQDFNLPPIAGGDTLWGQHQDYPLGMLADRASWDSSMVQQTNAATVSTNEMGEDVTWKAIQALQKEYEAW